MTETANSAIIEELEKAVKELKENPHNEYLALTMSISRRDPTDPDNTQTRTATVGYPETVFEVALEGLKNSCDGVAQNHNCKETDPSQCELHQHGNAPLLLHAVDEILKDVSINHTAYTLKHLKGIRKKLKQVQGLLEMKVDTEAKLGHMHAKVISADSLPEELKGPLAEFIKKMTGIDVTDGKEEDAPVASIDPASVKVGGPSTKN
jgi:hypothetical protein